MGLFGKPRAKGLTQYELTHKHVGSKMDSVFSHSLSSDKKRAALHTALGLAGDRDTNMPHGQHGGIIQRDEFESAVGGLEKGGVINPKEAAQLRKIANDSLNS